MQKRLISDTIPKTFHIALDTIDITERIRGSLAGSDSEIQRIIVNRYVENGFEGKIKNAIHINIPFIAVDLFPSTVLSVQTTLPGADPADVERNITLPLERALSSSHGLADMTSVSNFERSFIKLNFACGTDMDKAMTDAQTLVNKLANSLPDNASAPTVLILDEPEIHLHPACELQFAEILILLQK